jgi:hypothetical protein
MFDNVNFWMNRNDISNGKTFEVLPYLTDVTEWQNEQGYNCTGKLKNYSVCVSDGGISMKGSLAKNHFGDNIHTLTRKDAQWAIEELSDQLHIDINVAKVTRLDISTVLYTKHPPADYFPYLGEKPYFKRLQVHDDTLQYNNHQRQIIFYDKKKEAMEKGVPIPDILKTANLLRYELRYTKRLNKQLNTDLTAGKLYVRPFYDSLIENWYKELKDIQKLKKQSFMVENITTIKDAETAFFASLLHKSGQGVIDEFLNALRAENTFNDRQRYYELKKRLTTIFTSVEFHEKNELMQEVEEKAFNIAKYAR